MRAILIRTKLTVALIALAIVPLAVIGAGAYIYARRAVEHSVLNHLKSLVTTQKHRIEAVVQAHRRMLLVAASSEALVHATGHAARGSSSTTNDDALDLLSQWRLRYPGFRNLALLSPDGRIVVTTDPDHLPVGPAPAALFHESGAMTAILAGPAEAVSRGADREREFGMVVFARSSAVYMRAGPLLAELDLSDLSRITLDYTGMGITGETVVAERDLDGNARYLTAVRWDPAAALTRIVAANDRRIVITRALRGEEAIFTDAVDYRGVPVLAATAYLPDERWGIVVKIDHAEAFAPLQRLGHVLIAVFATTCVAVIVAGSMFTNRITAPIVRLTRVAQAINRGELGERVAVTTRDEIGVLGDAFNRMTADLLTANSRLEERVQERTAALEREIAERAHAEDRFQLAFEHGPEPMVMVDAVGRLLLANERVERVFAYGRDDLAGRYLEHLFPERVRPRVRGLHAELLANASARHVATAVQLPAQTKDGAEVPVEIGLSVVETEGGALVLGVIRDLRERQRAEASRALLAAIVDSADDAIFSITTDMLIATWNAGAEALYGYRADEIVGQPVSLLWPPEERAEELLTIGLLMEERRSVHQEARRQHKDGHLLDVLLTRSPIRTSGGTVLGLSAIARDITARKQAEQALRASLHEKEVLLKEIHHRVKNNLQIVTSLLNLQAGGAGDARIAALLRETQHRVKSMALMHETLYRGGNLAALDLRQYVRELVEYLRHSYGTALRRVSLVADVEALPLPLDSAIPCGLILTELVSNAFKHAFPEPLTGTLRIDGRYDEGGAYVLRVVDDGRGMPADVDPLHSRSLGLQLVANLARQLHAGFTRDDTDRGTSFTIRFAASRVDAHAVAETAG